MPLLWRDVVAFEFHSVELEKMKRFNALDMEHAEEEHRSYLLQTHIFAVSLICNYEEDYGVEHRPLALPRTIHR